MASHAAGAKIVGEGAIKGSRDLPVDDGSGNITYTDDVTVVWDDSVCMSQNQLQAALREITFMVSQMESMPVAEEAPPLAEEPEEQAESESGEPESDEPKPKRKSRK
jgi:hypothetical protein